MDNKTENYSVSNRQSRCLVCFKVFKVARLQGYKITRSEGYKIKRLQGQKVTSLQGYNVTRLQLTRLQGQKDRRLHKSKSQFNQSQRAKVCLAT